MLRIIQLPSKVRVVKQLLFVPSSFDGGSSEVSLVIIAITAVFLLCVVFYRERPPYQVEKKKEMGVPEVSVSEEGILLQGRLPVKFQDVKFKDPKHEIFMRIDMKHSYYL